MEFLTGNIGWMINGADTWMFLLMFAVAACAAHISLSEDAGTATSDSYFTRRMNGYAFTFAGFASLALTSLVFGLCVDEKLGIVGLLTYLLLLAVFMVPFFLEGRTHLRAALARAQRPVVRFGNHSR